MYCSLDKIDLTAQVGGRPIAVQTDHRARAEIEAEPELSALFAMVRVINAREYLLEQGHVDLAVHYVVADDPPPALREALVATGAVIKRSTPLGDDQLEPLGAPSEEAASALADRQFTALARRTAARVGTRDLAMALRMLEDQTFTAPPERTDEPAYWQRVLELAALTGELLRAKHPTVGRWIQTDRSLIPFGFQVSSGEGATVMFPTNRAQRAIDGGRDESLFKLLLAADEALDHPPDATGKLMPSLRDRRSIELDDVIWRPLLAEPGRDLRELPIIVCGVDGENTFGMLNRAALDRPADELMAEALANLADEQVEGEELHADDMMILIVTGSFYAAEKILDEEFMRTLHRELHATVLAAATPARGLLLVTSADDAAHLAKFTALARMRHDDSGPRAITAAVMLVTDGLISGCLSEPGTVSS